MKNLNIQNEFKYIRRAKMKQNNLINYSKIDVQKIINSSLKKDKKLDELDYFEINNVLEYINEHKLNIKLFKCKYFNILTQKFVAVEYIMSDRFAKTEEKVFDCFNGFYNYTNGDIYDKTCFYGYEFKTGEIEKFNLNLYNINFISFTNETIDNFSFDTFKKIEEEKNNIKKQTVTKLNEWFSRNSKVSTLEGLKKAYSDFKNNFESATNFRDLNDIFFSIILRNNKDGIKDAIVEFYCESDNIDGLNFDDILLRYGVDTAKKTIELMENFYFIFSYKKIYNRKKRCKIFEESTFDYERKIYFDNYRYVYVVRESYISYTIREFSKYDYFLKFDELVNFLNGDLTNADLSKAPIDKNKILNYKINEATILPYPQEYDTYFIDKLYDIDNESNSGKFIVKQSWYSNGILLKDDIHEFNYFFDFIYFLKGDLTNADLISCEGLENVDLKKFKIDNIKVTSNVLSTQKNEIEDMCLTFDDYELEFSRNNELNNNITSAKSFNEFIYTDKVSYITDIHLPHRLKCNKCKSEEDIINTIRKLITELSKTSNYCNLIGGDISNDIYLYEMFLRGLYLYNKNNLKHCHYFITLGNHELWKFNDLSLQEIINKYKNILDGIDSTYFHLVHNNLFYYDCEWKEISENDLNSFTINEIKHLTQKAKIIIFGGLGFSGENEKFNADNGVYKEVITRTQEKEESFKFKLLYDKVTKALYDRNLIILTHMPIQDWHGKDAKTIDGVVYVSGHTHRNNFYDDGLKRVYEDNQTGYYGKDVHFNSFDMNFGYDLFKEFDDGIHEITNEEYHDFYRGINQVVVFNRQFKKLYLLKKKGNYMFFMLGLSGNLSILNGGQLKTVKNDINYYYNKLEKYAKSVNLFMANYVKFQNNLALEIKKIGGDGKIHGAIIDIDYNNHIYVNPLDGKLVPYNALSMTCKYVYKNIPSLLKFECPALFINYENLLEELNNDKSLSIYDSNQKLSKSCKFEDDTTIYKYSRIIKNLQYTTNNHIVRLWINDLNDEASEENGKLIVTKLLSISEE